MDWKFEEDMQQEWESIKKRWRQNITGFLWIALHIGGTCVVLLPIAMLARLSHDYTPTLHFLAAVLLILAFLHSMVAHMVKLVIGRHPRRWPVWLVKFTEFYSSIFLWIVRKLLILLAWERAQKGGMRHED